MDLIDAGAEDIEIEENEVLAHTDFNNFVHMQRALEEKGIEMLSANLQRVPNNTVVLTEEQMDDVLKLIDKLEDDEDIQNVFHNIA